MKKVMVILGATALLASCNQGGVNKNAKLSSELDSVSYSLGVLIGSDIAQNTDKEAPLKQELIFSGLSAGIDKDTVVLTRAKAMQIFQAHMQKQQLEENKKKEGVVTTKSGLQYQVIKKGKGKKAQKGQIAVVNYTGTLTNGKEFDSSLKEGRKPFEVPVAEGRVIKGWDEALQLMNVGTKLKLLNLKRLKSKNRFFYNFNNKASAIFRGCFFCFYKNICVRFFAIPQNDNKL